MISALAAGPAVRAAEVLAMLPQDALGFILLNNLGESSKKVEMLRDNLGGGVPTPLGLLSAITGISDGLDRSGDVLLALLPSDGDGEAPEFCLWLPVKDYDKILASIGVPLRDGIAEFRAGEENLLIARHGDWALLMDADQRSRMSQILATRPTNIAVIDRWSDWLNENDVAAVLLKNGTRTAIHWAAGLPQPANGAERAPVEEIVDGAVEGDDASPVDRSEAAAGKLFGPVHDVIRKLIQRSAMLHRALATADAVGFAVRFDNQGNAIASTRLLARASSIGTKSGDPNAALPDSLYEGGDFVYYGAGSFPPALAVGAEWFVGSAANDLKTGQRLVIDRNRLRHFTVALRATLADVRSFVVVKQPGGKSEGITTNDFVIVRVGSARVFVDKASEAMRLWNTMNREATGGEPLIFDVKELKLADRDVVQYSLDVVGAEAQLLPETRQAMEAFFGPDRKMQIWLVPVDNETVLVGSATTKEMEVALAALNRKQPLKWDVPALAATNKLLPAEIDWRFYLNPRIQQLWLHRQSEAMTGPVFGGRHKKEFPESPPIGFAGATRDDEITATAVIPVETIKAAGRFFSPDSE
jgi:hypothetical protein